MYLYKNRNKLKSAGFHLLQSAGKMNSRALPAYCLGDERFDDFFRDEGITTTEERAAFRRDLDASLDAEISSLGSDTHTVVISSEHFHSRIRNDEEMERLQQLLARYFDSIEIICYLREQATTCASWYSTSLKSGGISSFKEFMKRCSPSNYYFNYFNMLSNWERYFGAGSLDVSLFGRGHFLNGDLLDDFTAKLNPNLVGSLNKSIQVENESLTSSGQALARAINIAFPIRTARHEVAPLRDKCKRLIAQKLKGKGQQPSLATQQRITSEFSECNELLRKKYFPSMESLFPAPIEADEAAFELESSFPDVLLAVLNILKKDGAGVVRPDEYVAVSEAVGSSIRDAQSGDGGSRKSGRKVVLNNDDARALRRAAIKLERRDKALALQLIGFASEINSGLPQVQEKLEEYQRQIDEKPAPLFIISFHGNAQPADEEAALYRTRLAEWLQKLKAPGGIPLNGVLTATTIRSDRSMSESDTPIMGAYSVIEAESFEAALAITRDCPYLDIGGSLQVSPVHELGFGG